MLGADPDIAGSALRLWVAAGAAAVLVFLGARAFTLAQTRMVARIGVVAVAALLGVTMGWAFFGGGNGRDQDAERRALELRSAELDNQALAPGSALACLDALAGDTVETACEKAVFAAPATAASATAYVAARLRLLTDIAAYARRGGAPIDDVLLPLRHGLETDRFGIVAHVLATRDGCRRDDCKALSLLSDPSRVRANLAAQPFEHLVAQYADAWAHAPETPLADASQPGAMAPGGAPGQRKTLVDIDFPSAASIPAVSIMNPEPKGPMTPAAAVAAVTAGADSSAKAEAAAAASAPAAQATKRPVRRSANPPAQTAAAPPPEPVEPVWAPGATLASPSPPARTAPVSGPVQLNPFPSPPDAGGTTRTQ